MQGKSEAGVVLWLVVDTYMYVAVADVTDHVEEVTENNKG